MPQPEFLGALIEFFSSKKLVASSPHNETAYEPEKSGRKPLLFGMIVEALRTNYPEYFGEMFEAYFYATAVVLASAFNVMLMHPYLLSQMHLGMKMRVCIAISIELFAYENFRQFSCFYQCYVCFRSHCAA